MVSQADARYSILLIEDDRDQIQFIKTVLGSSSNVSLDIHAEETVGAGLIHLGSTQVDLILLDLHLPDSAGLETFRTVEGAAGEIPIIIFSGNKDVELALEAVREGAQDYLVKGDAREPLLSRSIMYAIERKRITTELEHTRNALEESNRDLKATQRELRTERDLFISGPTVVIKRGADTGLPVLFVSQNFSRFGYVPEAIISDRRSFQSFVHPDDWERLLKELSERQKERADVLEIEYRIVDAAGEPVWLHEITRFQYTADGSPLSQHAYVVDVSGRKRAEQSLTVTRRRFETIIGSLNEAVYELDHSGRIGFITEAIGRILGYTPHELQGTEFRSLIIEGRRDEWSETLSGMLRGRITSCEFPVARKDGGERKILLSSRRLEEHGQVAGIAGVITDVTEQRTMEETVRDVQTKTQQYLDIAEVMFLSLNAEGTVTLINKKGSEILGYAEHDVIGRNWMDLAIPERMRADMRTYFRAIVEGSVDLQHLHENSIVTSGGDERLILWHNSLLRDARGHIIGVLSSGEDITDRRRIEEEVKGSRELIELALWGADLGAWEWYIDSDRLTFNQRALAMFGFPDEEPPRYTEFRKETLPEEDVPRLEELVQAHLAGESSFYQAETWMISRSGEWRWILERGKVVEYDGAGNPVRLAGTYLDLTERKFAAIALEDSEKKFRLLAENSVDIIWTSDAEFNLTFVSPSVVSILGYAPEEMVEIPFTEVIHEAHRQDVLDQLDSKVHVEPRPVEERSVRLEVQLIKKNGELLWTELVATPVLDQSGRLVTIHGNSRDIQRRKLAQLALAESEEKYRLLVENQTDLVVKIDLDGKFLFVSPSYCRLFDKSEEELLQQTFFPLVHEEDKAQTLEAMKALLEPPHTAYVEQRALTRDGWRWLAWSDTAVFDDEGEIVAVIGVGRDVTERKMAEHALVESEKRLRTVISNLPVVLFSYDVQGMFTLSEGKGLEALGLEPGQVVGNSVFEVYRDMPEVLDQVKRSLKGESFTGVVTVGDMYFETWYTPLKSENDALLQVIGVAVDISQRVKTEEELHRYRDHLEELVEARTLELERTNERLKRFRFALDSAADNIYIIDPETMKFVDHNESAVRALGYSSEELLTMGPADIRAADAEEDYQVIYEDVRDGKLEVGMFETRHRRSNGEEFPVEIFVRSFERGEGQLLVSTVRDITRRKEVELALKDSESKYRNVLENANEAIIVLQDNLLKFFNYKVLELTGLRERDLVDLPILEFVHPDDHASVQLQYEKRIGGHHLPESYDVRMFDSNGTIKWMEVRDVLIDWEDKPATLNFFNDITARKNAEQYIRFQASLLSIVRNSVVAIDPTGRVTYWNSFAETLYGWTADEVEGKKLGDNPTFGKDFSEDLLPQLRKKRHWEGEVTRKHRDGHPIDLYTMWNAIMQDGTVTGYVGIGIDMSERKKLERELLQSQKLASLGVLSEGIAHELRNPLGYASSAAQLLLGKESIAPEELEKYSNIIRTGVEKANKIVENLLLIGKPKGQLMKKQLDLVDAIEEAHGLAETHELIGNVVVEKSFVSKPLYVTGNREMVVQLFYNLFANAFHAMGKDGILTIEGESNEDQHIIRVTDSGPGIPDDIVESIFDPFFTTSKTDQGVGLGLTLCYFIMDDHDGRIEFDDSVTQGASFIITFPSD
ncbi:MAG: hypothetical protein C0600_10555 [Ignavibacteria bacterium]|nr:MAG: hypothetical protein C0600_10555 [Ignavibacteria bacterium]